VSAPSQPDSPGVLAGRYLEHVLAGRGTEAIESVLAPLATGLIDVVDLYEQVLTPTAERVGELWHRSEISVADEHFATQLNQHVISAAARLDPPASRDGGVVVLACPPGEQHDTGLRMLSHFLDAAGYDTHLLGASTPVRALTQYVQRVGAIAVGLSIASPLAIPGLAQATAALAALDPAPRVFVGGRCAQLYPKVPEAVGAAATGTSVRDALDYLAAA
jgi:methanogenic corrinoid protein MtbC1